MKENRRNERTSQRRNQTMSGTRKQKSVHNQILRFSVIFSIICIITITCGTSFVAAKSSAVSDTANTQITQKYYTSVFVKPGETLWKLAEQYMSDEYQNIDSYIAEVKTLNNLEDDQINAGSYICLPYYEVEEQ